MKDFTKPSDTELRKQLSPLQYEDQAVALHDEYKARKKTLDTARKGKKS